MADPVATVEKIVKIGLKIKAAVDTVHHNQEDCNEIRRRVLRFSAILSQLQQAGMMNDSPAMSGALEDLEETLQHALELVTACQETSTIRHLIKAGDLSKQLRRVKEDMLNKVMLASFAINTHTTILLLTIQAGGQPPLRQSQDAGVETSHSNQSTDDARSDMDEVENNVLAGSSTLLVALREFRWSELKDATNGFSDGNIIGQGGTFIVYKGVLKDGTIVAIKKTDDSDSERWRHTYNQLRLIASKLQHKNIVKFIGYSHQVMSTYSGGALTPPVQSSKNKKVMSTYVVQLFKRRKDQSKESGFYFSKKESGFIWVEGYVPNQNLGMIIRGSQDYQLDWSSLFRIIDGVAQGIQYLHEQRIVHMDVKPDNILLDSDMNPIITDFLLSIALEDNDEMDLRHMIRGTFGYIDPVYIREGIVSTKSDVYGFGITLLVTVRSISRRGYVPPDPSTLYGYGPLDEWAWNAWEAGRIEEEFDPSLFDKLQLKKIKRCVEVGLLCTQHDPKDRPTMADVVEMLHGERDLPVPKMPSWLEEDSEDKVHGGSSSPASWSDSDGSISPR